MLIIHPFFRLKLSNTYVSKSWIVSASLSQHNPLLVHGNWRQEWLEFLPLITFITSTEKWKRNVGRIGSCHIVAVFWRCYPSNKLVGKTIPNHDTCYGSINIYKQHQQYRVLPKIRGMLCRSNLRSDGENSIYVCLNNIYHHSAKCALLDGILENILKLKTQFKRIENKNENVIQGIISWLK